MLELGTFGIEEQPESGAVSRSNAGETMTVVYRGRKSDLEAEQPEVGDSYLGRTVLKSDLKPEKGELATLTIELGGPYEEVGETPLKTRYEIIWQQLEKPILVHPLFSSAADIVAQWAESPDRASTVDTYPGFSGQPNAPGLAERILKGVESYLVFTPVITKTTIYSNRPSTGGCGKLVQPPSASGYPSGYYYLKTADGAVQQDDGKWIRTEQWTGADEWDQALYEAEA